ncbi:MAG: hypothetical protein F6K18_16345 [Okeania sp. SIO2C2]|uniref:hypothetical protein n=1 Tax=Okeania sp. SIO2C2 TaxID=2607787 RepID=UPI0013B88804|nr:hypothetical protein [Okeania sp. SIO2C2]NEP88272.1 hypothetical protein [Okeania sp. SIO2C2]
MLKKLSIAAATALGIVLAGGTAQAQTFDINGTNSWDNLGDSDNEVLTLDIADALGMSGSAINLFGVEWDVTIETFGISWLSEADIQITDTSGNVLFDLDPGTGTTGTDTFVGSESSSFYLPDGLVNVEFYESFDDVGDAIDATFLDTSILTFDAELTETIFTQARTFDISGTNSWDNLGDSDNEVLTLDIADAFGLGSGSAVNLFGVDWDLTIETFGGSWLSEAVILFSDTNGNSLFSLTAGAGNSVPGTETFVDSGSFLTPIFLADGLVNIEFYESFDDVGDAIDATYLDTSTLTFHIESEPADVPEPAFLLGFVLLGGELYRRKRTNKG